MPTGLFSKYKEYIILALLLFVYGILQWRYINIDFWNDEIFTLKNFVFTSLNNTVSDYPVPNNHVFFNLLSNIYLKLIGIDNMSDLMDLPYKLRLLPLLFSVLTIIFVFKTAKEFFNNSIAFLSVIILITTIPYINFALQIRGYGLSTLFVSVITYYVFKYLHKKNFISLVIISLSSALIIYTIPSNVFFIASIIAVLSICLVILWFSKKSKNEKQTFQIKQVFYILIALTAGSLLSLALYAPIFSNVFMNSYVDNYTISQHNQLTYFLPDVFLSFTTQRWVLVGFFVMGMVFNFKEYKARGFFMLFLIFTLFLPFLFTYIRDDNPPVRVFEFIVPLFCLFISVGIFSFWNLLVRLKKFEWVFLLSVLIYSTSVFAMETKKIDNKLLECIKTGEKMQDLYYQYYLSHYHPFKDLKYFKENYYTDTTILVLMGSEPHDLPDYLDKFNIRTRSAKKLDTLLARNESLFVISNFPGKLEGYSDYNIQPVNKEFSYYNIYRFKKNKEFYNKVSPIIEALNLKYKDSVRYVFNISNAYQVNEIKNISKTLIINSNYQKKAGEIISFVNEKPYLCYFQTNNASIPNIDNLYNIIFDERAKVISYVKNSTFSYKIVASGRKETGSQCYFNDYEKEYPNWTKSYSLDNTFAFSGNRSEKLDSKNVYSSTFSALFQDLNKKGKVAFEISGKLKFRKDKSAMLVMEVQRNKTNYSWQGIDLNDYYTGKTDWEKIIATIVPDKELQKDDVIKIYIWNNQNNTLWIDDFKVEIK